MANHFREVVESEVRLTDGTTRRQILVPCREYHFFPPQRYDPWRKVFVERLTFRREGAVIGVYEGARVEALGAFGGVAVLDESGLRRVVHTDARALSTRCAGTSTSTPATPTGAPRP